MRALSKGGLVLLLLGLTLFSGCGVQTAVVRSATSPIIDGGFEAMLAEPDLQIARTALESNLKLIEGLLRSDPSNERLRLLAAQGFFAYGLGFAEDENPERAKALYLRGRDYARTWLLHEIGVDPLAIQRLDDFEAAVKELPDEALPGVFWLANNWANVVLLSLSDIESVGQLPRVEMLMQWVLEHDETFYFAGPHLFFSAYYGSRSPMLGGSPQKAREHIEKQKELTGGTMLLGKFFEVKYVHLPALDGDAARKVLEEILAQTPDQWPDDEVLINRLAQKKAKRLLDHLEDYL